MGASQVVETWDMVEEDMEGAGKVVEAKALVARGVPMVEAAWRVAVATVVMATVAAGGSSPH